MGTRSTDAYHSNGGDHEPPPQHYEFMKQHCPLHPYNNPSVEEKDEKDTKTFFITNLLSSRNALILLVSIVLLLTIIIPLFYFYYIIPKQICDEQNMLNWPSIDCRGDGFYDMTYVLNNSCGYNLKRYVRYKFVDDVVNDVFYNFSRAKQECEKLGATLWEVLDGEPEWNAFIGISKELLRSSLWLNAKVVGECDEHLNATEEEPDPPCNLLKEASEGNGVEVKWPSTHYSSRYSRLIRDLTSNNNDVSKDMGNKCVFVDKSNNHLWDVHDCSSQKFWGLCVKRQCLWPEHQSPEK